MKPKGIWVTGLLIFILLSSWATAADEQKSPLALNRGETHGFKLHLVSETLQNVEGYPVKRAQTLDLQLEFRVKGIDDKGVRTIEAVCRGLQVEEKNPFRTLRYSSGAKTPPGSPALLGYVQISQGFTFKIGATGELELQTDEKKIPSDLNLKDKKPDDILQELFSAIFGMGGADAWQLSLGRLFINTQRFTQEKGANEQGQMMITIPSGDLPLDTEIGWRQTNRMDQGVILRLDGPVQVDYSKPTEKNDADKETTTGPAKPAKADSDGTKDQKKNPATHQIILDGKVNGEMNYTNATMWKLKLLLDSQGEVVQNGWKRLPFRLTVDMTVEAL